MVQIIRLSLYDCNVSPRIHTCSLVSHPICQQQPVEDAAFDWHTSSLKLLRPSAPGVRAELSKAGGICTREGDDGSPAKAFILQVRVRLLQDDTALCSIIPARRGRLTHSQLQCGVCGCAYPVHIRCMYTHATGLVPVCGPTSSGRPAAAAQHLNVSPSPRWQLIFVVPTHGMHCRTTRLPVVTCCCKPFHGKY